jgi:hypothetical protein
MERGVRHSMIVQAMNTATFHSRLGVLGLSTRRDDGGAVRDGAALGCRAAWAPTGVSALGAADAGNDGPVGVSKAARQGSAPAAPEIRRRLRSICK